ncbi:MAG: hypothetical protein JWL76_2170 [Thermoleophilia bacterium]|nr:hypothetical protein [Thermoleophilia bacterium]
MTDMTRKLAREQPATQPGSGTIAWRPGSQSAHGMSQNQALTEQPLDSRMSQQFHQPAQGTDGGHAGSVNADEAAGSSAPAESD